MAVKVKPMADYIVVVAEEAQSKTASGLYLPPSAAEKPKIAQVVAVGSSVKDIKVSDRVLYKNEYEAVNVKVDGDSYIVVGQQNVIAIVNG